MYAITVHRFAVISETPSTLYPAVVPWRVAEGGSDNRIPVAGHCWAGVEIPGAVPKPRHPGLEKKPGFSDKPNQPGFMGCFRVFLFFRVFFGI